MVQKMLQKMMLLVLLYAEDSQEVSCGCRCGRAVESGQRASLRAWAAADLLGLASARAGLLCAREP
eukprot:181187-Prymnesium_polylepis.1